MFPAVAHERVIVHGGQRHHVHPVGRRAGNGGGPGFKAGFFRPRLRALDAETLDQLVGKQPPGDALGIPADKRT